jgi:ribosomal protein S18 acetylase RimI-like enzyme
MSTERHFVNHSKKQNNLLIRPYRDEDSDAVWDLHNRALNDVGAHGGNGPWDDDLHHIIDVYENQKGAFLVGEIDGRIVAMGALKRTDANRAEIKRMRVHPEFQRRGFGSAMLEALINKAREFAYLTLHLDTTTIQVAAQQLYKKYGFQQIGTDNVAGFDLLLYEKELADN